MARTDSLSLAPACGTSVLLHAVVLMLPVLGNNALGKPFFAPEPAAFVVTLASPNTGGSRTTTPIHSAIDSATAAAAASVSPEDGADAGLFAVPQPAFYAADQLTKQPQALAVAELNVPEIQVLPGSGRLVLKLWIDARGTVVDAATEETELPEMFARTALDAFRQSRFLPGERNGVPVGALVRIEVNYEDVPSRR